MRWKAFWLVTSAGASLMALCGHAHIVEACGIRMTELDPRRELVALGDAQKAYEAGDFDRTVGGLYRYRASVFSKDESANDKALRKRGELLLARAVVASDGVARPGASPSESAEERREALVWASQRIEELARQDEDNPQVATELGVALSKLPEKRLHALAMLNALAKRDLVTSAGGWAALSWLRDTEGGRAEAARRCRLMAVSPEVECATAGRDEESAGPSGDTVRDAASIAAGDSGERS